MFLISLWLSQNSEGKKGSRREENGRSEAGGDLQTLNECILRRAEKAASDRA